MFYRLIKSTVTIFIAALFITSLLGCGGGRPTQQRSRILGRRRQPASRPVVGRVLLCHQRRTALVQDEARFKER